MKNTVVHIKTNQNLNKKMHKTMMSTLIQGIIREIIEIFVNTALFFLRIVTFFNLT